MSKSGNNKGEIEPKTGGEEENRKEYLQKSFHITFIHFAKINVRKLNNSSREAL
jgi:hypothetical protein